MFESNRKRAASGGDSRKSGKRRLSSGDSGHQPQTMLTLPRVELWCRDQHCPYSNHKHQHQSLTPQSTVSTLPNSRQGVHHYHGHSQVPQDTVSTLPNPKQSSHSYQPQIKSNFCIESETPGEFWNSSVMNSNQNIRSVFDASTLELPITTYSTSRTSGPISHDQSASSTTTYNGTNQFGYGFDHGVATLDFTNQIHRPDNNNDKRKEGGRHHNSAPQMQQNRKRSNTSQQASIKSHPGYSKSLYENDGDSQNNLGNYPRSSVVPISVSSSSSRQGSFQSKMSRSTRAAAALASLDAQLLSSSSRSPSPALNDGFLSDFSYTPPPMKVPTFCNDCNVNPVNLAHPGNFSMSKGDPANFFSVYNYPTLRRDSSFTSCGGFTLNGTGHNQGKKDKMSRFCSSHKIALVVSTFSLFVTLGLIVTLILMKKKGMMDGM